MQKILDSSMLGALRCFACAGQLLSFTRAADMLSLTQSAVSQQIRQLENRLGYALFVREHRRLSLTREGTMLLEGVRRGFDEIETTLVRIASADDPVRVGCCPSFAMLWLVPRLSDFHLQFSRNPVQLKAEFTAAGLPDHDTTGVDIAIRYSVDDFSDIEHADALLDEWLLPVATPAYLERHPSLRAGKLDRKVAFLHDAAAWTGSSDSAEWQAWLEAVKPAWLPRIDGPRFNLGSMAFNAALNHQGVAIGRVSMLLDDLRDGRLVPVVPVAIRSPARYWMIRRADSAMSVGSFRAWIRQQCAHHALRRAHDIGQLGVSLGQSPEPSRAAR